MPRLSGKKSVHIERDAANMDARNRRHESGSLLRHGISSPS
jgi:hypothetical protein